MINFNKYKINDYQKYLIEYYFFLIKYIIRMSGLNNVVKFIIGLSISIGAILISAVINYYLVCSWVYKYIVALLIAITIYMVLATTTSINSKLENFSNKYIYEKMDDDLPVYDGARYVQYEITMEEKERAGQVIVDMYNENSGKDRKYYMEKGRLFVKIVDVEEPVDLGEIPLQILKGCRDEGYGFPSGSTRKYCDQVLNEEGQKLAKLYGIGYPSDGITSLYGDIGEGEMGVGFPLTIRQVQEINSKKLRELERRKAEYAQSKSSSEQLKEVEKEIEKSKEAAKKIEKMYVDTCNEQFKDDKFIMDGMLDASNVKPIIETITSDSDKSIVNSRSNNLYNNLLLPYSSEGFNPNINNQLNPTSSVPLFDDYANLPSLPFDRENMNHLKKK